MRHSVFSIAVLLLAAHSVVAQVVTERNPERAREIARQRGMWTRQEDGQGRVIELQAIVRGIPRYYITHNLDAAATLSVDKVWPGGSGGLNLTGAGIKLGIWDGGAVYTAHREFTTRAIQRDTPASYSTHSTHVSGTMIAVGNWLGNASFPAGQSKGMCFQGKLDCYDWDYDSYQDANHPTTTPEMSVAAAAGLRLSNHSYGMITGWYYDGQDWYWFGDVTVSAVEDYRFGYYDENAQAWDQIAFQNPQYLFVKSAGNDRTDTGPDAGSQYYYFDPNNPYDWSLSTLPRNPDGNGSGFDTLADAGNAKNGLTVGAVKDLKTGYQGASKVTMTEFSSWGPTDDGRIKPDVVGNGYELFSPTAVTPTLIYWGVMSGTSMASPNVTGTLGLLVQHWRGTHASSADMRSATLKALVIHTTDEAGTHAGPDYTFGWGLVNALKAVQTVTFDNDQPLTITEQTLNATTPGVVMDIPSDGKHAELRATLCWTDPAGTPDAPALNDRTKMLVNDLDLRITGPDGAVYYPWVLDPNNPSAAATTGDNITDNVEQIVIPTPAVGRFTLTVSHKRTLAGGVQAFSLIVTGMPSADCDGNGTPDAQQIAADPTLDCNLDGVIDTCEVPLKPTIAAQPHAVTGCVGQPVTFDITVDGIAPFQYQWRKNGAPINGATQKSYTIPATGLTDGGSYDVVTTNTCGSVTSDAVVLTVQYLTVTADPHSQTVEAGESITLSVGADGPAPLTYQWEKDGEPIAGAVQSSYAMEPVMMEHAGTYDVIVTSPCGSVTSATAVLTVTLGALQYPTPRDAATSASIESDLFWGNVFSAETYDVHFGASTPPVLIGTSTGTVWKLSTLEYSTTYYWQIVARAGTTVTEGPVWSFTTRPQPLQPPTAPTAPVPADGAVGVPADVSLSWGAAERATTYKVLLGDDVTMKNVRFEGSAIATQWVTSSLAAGQTYYWRIIAKNDAGFATGPVWSFTTASPTAAASNGNTTNSGGTSTGDTQSSTADSSTGTTADSGQEIPAGEDTSSATPGEVGKPSPTAGAALCPTASASMLVVTVLSLWGTARPRRVRRD